jgi:D-proline reductase (dithiol) PrdB
MYNRIAVMHASSVIRHERKSMAAPFPIPDEIAALRDAYQHWLAVTRPQLDAHEWGAAFRNPTQPYPYFSLRLRDVPLVALGKPLNQAAIVLIDSAGVYVDGQPRFDDQSVTGDISLRLVPNDADPASLHIAHAHYDHSAAEQDINSVFPINRLHEIAAAGLIGAFIPQVISLSGYMTDAEAVASQVSAEVFQAVRDLRADGALLVPV